MLLVLGNSAQWRMDMGSKAAEFKARNQQTGEIRSFRLSDAVFFRVVDQGWDYCAGPCKCRIELDGECPQGWPARSEAALMML